MSNGTAINNQKLLAQGVRALNQQARRVIEKRLIEYPNAGATWFKLGELCRGMGDLEHASRAYQKAIELEYQLDLSHYLLDITANSHDTRALNYPKQEQYTPAPFVHRHDFLNSQEVEKIWHLFDQHLYDLKPSVVGSKHSRKINTSIRQSVLLSGQNAAQFEALIRVKLMTQLEQACQRFGVPIPKSSHLVTQVTSHGGGDYYRVHSDHGVTYPRVLSYVYYFSQQPQQFTGGELQLLDSDLSRKTYNTNGTLIEPTHNSLIVFPSEYFHQVCPVRSSEIHRKYGRNSINGWLSTAT